MGGGPLNSPKLYDCAVNVCGCHAVSLYWNHKKGQITGCYDPHMVYLALEEIQICLIKFNIKLLSCEMNTVIVIVHRLKIKGLAPSFSPKQ